MPLAAFSRVSEIDTARSGCATWLRLLLELKDWERLATNKKGSRERDPYALSPSIRFRRGGIGPPREEETADYYNARPMPEQRRIPIRSGSDESNGFTPIQSSTIASADNRPLRFLTILTMRLHSLEYCSYGDGSDGSRPYGLSVKITEIVVSTSIGSPLNLVGEYRHCRTARTADSSRTQGPFVT